MSDIGLAWNIFSADFVVAANDLEMDDSLETSVLLSLFLDRAAESGDQLPGDAGGDRRGWWADAVPVVEGDKIGSRLWLLGRAKQEQSVLTRAEEYAREALAWMLEDLVADEVTVTASFIADGVMLLEVVIHRPATDSVDFRFHYNWAAQQVRNETRRAA